MKFRSVILIISTLIIGFVLGMLTSAQIRYQKLKPMRVYFSEERFREGFYNIIQPDEQQKATIEQVLDKYARINHDLQDEFRKELDANMKAFNKELDSKLTDEQLNRLKEWDEKRQEMIRQSRRAFENDSTVRRRGHDPRQQGRPRYEHQPIDSMGNPPDSFRF